MAVFCENALRVERALRLAAASGNRLLAGSRVRVAVCDADVRALLVRVLRGFGARVCVDDAPGGALAAMDAVDPQGSADAVGYAVFAGSGIDFLFVDSAKGFARECSADVEILPPTVVGVDGTLAWQREPGVAARVGWAKTHMPVTGELVRRFSACVPSVRIGVNLVLEPKTAAFVLALAQAGHEVAVYAAAAETDLEVSRELARSGKVRVFAPVHSVRSRQKPVTGLSREDLAAVCRACASGERLSGESRLVDAVNAHAFLGWAPSFLVDDGAHLIRLAHEPQHASVLAGLRGACEETTSGVRPLRALAAVDALRLPVVVVNDARTKSDFDNLTGTGVSCVLAVCDESERLLGAGYRGVAGQSWLVYGYGPVGRGVARYAAVLGARVTVVEKDPVLALMAQYDGFAVLVSSVGRFDLGGVDGSAGSGVRGGPDGVEKAALAVADVVVSATGVSDTVSSDRVACVRSGCVLAVAGGVRNEIALDDLEAAGWAYVAVTADSGWWRPPRNLPVADVANAVGVTHVAGVAGTVDAADAADTAGVLVLGCGGGINYTVGEGNPIEVMDLSFATQVAGLALLNGVDLAAVPAVAVGVPGVSALSSGVVSRLSRGCDGDAVAAVLAPGVYEVSRSAECLIAGLALAARGVGV